MHGVIETAVYLRHAKEAGVSSVELQSIVNFIAAHPDAGDIMKGTGGARKVRYAKSGPSGKSGGYRVITYFAADDIPVFLLDIYVKGRAANLTLTERNSLASTLEQIATAYRRATKQAADRAKITRGEKRGMS